MNEQNNVAQPAVVVTLTRTLGAYGAAFDLPGPHRAFTYHHQPGNIGAHRLGAAWQKAASGSSGDLIDRGLELLKALQEVGFGVFEVSEIAAPADERQPSGNAGELPDAVRVPLDSLHADASYLVGRALDRSLSRAEMVAIIRSRIDEARAAIAALASAPEAGEAVGVAQPDGDTFRLSRPLPVGTKVYAAPQASAGNVRNAALEEAAKLMDQTLRSNGAALIRGLKRSQADKDSGQQRAGDAALARLAEPHTGMRVDYQGLLRQAREGLHDSPGLAEMLRQLQGHLRELGQRWYAGDTAVVDELLQLYCVESNARAALSATQAEQGELDA
ncbi:hypothetical protein [Achromobacter xylosoxidans]|uniref:hypothetical protein n=1 Tax=Alcaligenes xylosoxydans xylosoxydans TaxID=85698 RepID=UPI001EEB0FFA|nr:hypothetical protein [Achromobacter xylosoxidans]